MRQAFQVLTLGGRCLMVCQNKLEASLGLGSVLPRWWVVCWVHVGSRCGSRLTAGDGVFFDLPGQAILGLPFLPKHGKCVRAPGR